MSEADRRCAVMGTMSRVPGSAKIPAQVFVAGAADGPFAALPALLRTVCPDWTVGAAPVFAPAVGSGPPPTILVHLPALSAVVISAAEAFATLDGSDDRLVLMMGLCRTAAADATSDWQDEQDSAVLAAFTRYAALAWAPRGIRVNFLSVAALALGHGNAEGPEGCLSDVARTIRHMKGWRSMTGQTLQLGLG
jgi:NAD(P)-dependent dehydrogenase (short-subunit alcohol dehydrogenase family)